ncbi:hypothetical protein FS837_006280, partial [Tulasnella sp. UAMH 9824]
GGWVATVLSGLREREAVVTTLQRLASPTRFQPEPEQPRQLLAPVERPVITPPEDRLGSPYLPSPFQEYPKARAPSNETLPTSQAPSPADATPTSSSLDPNSPTASSNAIPSEQTTSTVPFGPTSDDVDDKAKDPAGALNTRLSGVTPAASVTGKLSQTNLLERPRRGFPSPLRVNGTDRVAFPLPLSVYRIPFLPLSRPHEDDESTTPNVDSPVPKQGAINPMDIILSAPDQTEPRLFIFDATSDDVDEKRNNPAPPSNLSWTRRSGVPLATSLMGRRIPQNDLLGTSSYSVPFPSLPGPLEDDEPTTPGADSPASKPGGMNALGIVLSAPRSSKSSLKSGSINPVGCSIKTLDAATTAISRGRATITLPQFINSAISTPSTPTDEGIPTSTTTTSPAPTRSTAPTSIDLQQIEWKIGTPSSIAYSPLESSNDVQAQVAEAGIQETPGAKVEETVAWWRGNVPRKDVRSSRQRRHPEGRSGYNIPDNTTDEDWKWAKTEGKKPIPVATNGSNNCFKDDEGLLRTEMDEETPRWTKSATKMGNGEPMLTMAASVPTPDENDDLDGDGFSKSQQQRANENSRKAMAMPFYGASSSHAQLLSDEEWDSLEQFEATPSSLPEISLPPSPLPIAVETEVVQRWVPPPPPTCDAVPTKINNASRTKKVFKKIVKRMKATFRLKIRRGAPAVA